MYWQTTVIYVWSSLAQWLHQLNSEFGSRKSSRSRQLPLVVRRGRKTCFVQWCSIAVRDQHPDWDRIHRNMASMLETTSIWSVFARDSAPQYTLYDLVIHVSRCQVRMWSLSFQDTEVSQRMFRCLNHEPSWTYYSIIVSLSLLSFGQLEPNGATILGHRWHFEKQHWHDRLWSWGWTDNIVAGNWL